MVPIHSIDSTYNQSCRYSDALKRCCSQIKYAMFGILLRLVLVRYGYLVRGIKHHRLGKLAGLGLEELKVVILKFFLDVNESA